MISCAWTGTCEIIPFDSIEYVEMTDDQTEVFMQQSKHKCCIMKADSKEFIEQYTAYLNHISKALNFIGDE